jgi:hypothetical protein
MPERHVRIPASRQEKQKKSLSHALVAGQRRRIDGAQFQPMTDRHKGDGLLKAGRYLPARSRLAARLETRQSLSVPSRQRGSLVWSICTHRGWRTSKLLALVNLAIVSKLRAVTVSASLSMTWRRMVMRSIVPASARSSG